ncbi:hypothetical protein NL676_011338 [Syzygium grande]|nr:hypothetical protein NL676_011338 [Syzygium grande]
MKMQSRKPAYQTEKEKIFSNIKPCPTDVVAPSDCPGNGSEWSSPAPAPDVTIVPPAAEYPATVFAASTIVPASEVLCVGARVTTAAAEYSTPALDGTIVPGEYSVTALVVALAQSLVPADYYTPAPHVTVVLGDYHRRRM